MPTGAITGYIDVAQIVLYGFWVFFAGLIFYLRREDKREGYPLDSDRTERAPRVEVIGFPRPPEPKEFLLPHGQGTRQAPRKQPPTRDIPGTSPAAPGSGMPLMPTGDPMRDSVGPASYAQREDVPDLTRHGRPKIVPMRVATDFIVEPEDPDPRGMSVIAGDGRVAGTVRDLWVDRAEPRILFYELELAGATESEGEAESASTRLLPYGYARVKFDRGQIHVSSIMAEHFAHVPQTASADQITRLEEDRITAYYASGHLYAHPSRQEPLI